MKRISLSAVFSAAVLAVSVGFAAPAAATTLTIGDSYYLGYINDGIPSSPTDEASYINTLLDQSLNSGPTTVGTEAYTRSGVTCPGGCPTAVTTGAVKDDTSPGTTLNLDGEWTYLLAKYDGPNFGSVVWYVAGLTSVTIPSGAGSQPYGLSHWSLYNHVTPPDGPLDNPLEVTPEPASLLLLGSGLVAIAARLRRRSA